MSLAHEDPTVPKGALVMAAVLIALALALTAATRLGFIPQAASPVAERSAADVALVSERSLRFLDRADGSVRIEDAATGEEIATYGDEGGGFVRGVMRGLARERRMNGVGQQPPFALSLWQDGSLSLTDSATGRVIELGAFGPDNRRTFMQLFERGDA
ncbi:MAG: photosynthetic complex assembly protein PuhC [Parasphingopyxis sp.]|uniref:photosynthetic complex assembly protein PuhC n=1 Tax=Parasphingopyxis sp. TaxID=1920299 RepID=UPI003FA0F319